jgi:hypothetical protein
MIERSTANLKFSVQERPPMTRAANCLTVFIATIAMVTGGMQLRAKADPLTVVGSASPLHPIHVGYYSTGYLAGPATCSYGSHFACWYGAYGGRYCGCWPGGDHPACPYGYHFSCRVDGFGGKYCACF